MTARDVPCNGCTACCRNIIIMLLPDEGDDVEKYEHEPVIDPRTGEVAGYIIPQKPNGECHYLGDGSCTIYEHRPAVCRAFDCRLQFLSFSRDERRKLFGKRNPIFDAARARLSSLNREETALALDIRNRRR